MPPAWEINNYRSVLWCKIGTSSGSHFLMSSTTFSRGGPWLKKILNSYTKRFYYFADLLRWPPKTSIHCRNVTKNYAQPIIHLSYITVSFCHIIMTISLTAHITRLKLSVSRINCRENTSIVSHLFAIFLSIKRHSSCIFFHLYTW